MNNLLEWIPKTPTPIAQIDRVRLAAILSTHTATELVAAGLRMRVATRAYTNSEKDFIQIRGTCFSHVWIIKSTQQEKM